MDHDLAMAIGMVVGVLSIPSVVSALSEGRAPRVASIAIIISGALMTWAIMNKPGGYKIEDLPDVLVKVVARYVK